MTISIDSLQYIVVLYKINYIISSSLKHYILKLYISVKTGDVQDYVLQSVTRLVLFTIIFILISFLLFWRKYRNYNQTYNYQNRIYS